MEPVPVIYVVYLFYPEGYQQLTDKPAGSGMDEPASIQQQ
jgi:hypothetical protein